MKIIALICFILMFAHRVAGQSLYIDTVKQNSINTQGGLYNNMSPFLKSHDNIDEKTQWHNKPGGYEAEYDDGGIEITDKPQKFKIDTISKQQFEKFKSGYKNRINTDSSKVNWTDTSFIIRFENSEADTFIANKNDYSFFEYYLGLLEPLNLYMVHSIAASQEVGAMVLYDKKTGRFYLFDSFVGNPVETIRVSPKTTYFLGYVNDLYDYSCHQMVYKINKEGKSYTLEPYYNLSMGMTWTKELVWVNETSFAIEATAGYSDEYNPLPSVFLKISFKE